MIRLNVVVEGQTEETLVRDVLAEELAHFSLSVTAHRVTTSRKHGRPFRGGMAGYAYLRRDLKLWMAQDRNADARFTTMVDLYRLPGDFPGYAESRGLADPLARARMLEDHLAADLPDRRLIPYIQVHEFEALLFAEPSALLLTFPNESEAVDSLAQVRAAAASPEHIDDGPETAPSKRIERLLPQFAKAVRGPIAARQIGLARLCAECRHFREWIDALRALPPV